jgi:hypothetical protein
LLTLSQIAKGTVFADNNVVNNPVPLTLDH